MSRGEGYEALHHLLRWWSTEEDLIRLFFEMAQWYGVYSMNRSGPRTEPLGNTTRDWEGLRTLSSGFLLKRNGASRKGNSIKQCQRRQLSPKESR